MKKMAWSEEELLNTSYRRYLDIRRIINLEEKEEQKRQKRQERKTKRKT